MSAARAEKPRQLDATDGRDLAVLALTRSQAELLYVHDVVERLAAAAGTDQAERAFALELAMGVMRHRLTLRRLIQCVLTGRWETLPPIVRHILLVGAYQVMWLERVPAYAAVSEAVRQARNVSTLRLSKLVNAVLRGLQRHRREQVAWSEDLPPRRTLRYDYDRAWLLNVDVFADPEQDPVGYLSAATSLPTEIVSRWIRFMGLKRTEQVCWASQWRPVTVLRPNRLKVDGAALARMLQEEGIKAELDEACGSVFVASAAGVRRSEAFRAGCCQVQDVTAQQAVLAAGIERGMTVLDLCAGQGTKSTQAAEQMADTGAVVACDVSPEKLARVTENCNRLGITSVRTVPAEELDALARRVGPFDVILVDVPCSNTGVLARRPEARFRFRLESLRQLARQQAALLERAISLAGPKTRIVYSTCSLEPEENEQVVRSIGEKHPDWLVAEVQQFDPAYEGSLRSWRDGGYVAVLERAAGTSV